MESTLPPLQAEQYSADPRLLEQQCQVRRSEEAFRKVVGRAATSVIFLGTSFTVYYLLPFYPTPMSVFLAIVAGIIAYRWPAVALLLMLLFAAPAYSYQLGVTIWALGILVTIALVLPFGLSRLRGASVGAAMGAAAGTLMLTPYFFLALPLLAAITLFRLKGSLSGAGWGLFMFLTFYLPFLCLARAPADPGLTVPLFLQVDYSQQPALNSLDLHSLKVAFQGQINNNIGGFPGFSAYFVQGWGGVVLVLTMLLSIVVAPAALNLGNRIKETRIVLRGLAPLISVLAIEMLFLVPVLLLAEPLGYNTGFETWEDIAVLSGIMVSVGILGLTIEMWLSQRNLKVKLKGDLSILSLELYDLLDSARRRLQQVASVCRSHDLGDERAAVTQCEERVALTLESIGAMSLARLDTSCNDFLSMKSQLCGLQSRLETKLFDHLAESRRNYKTTVDEALELGVPTLRDIIQTLPPPSDEREFGTALAEQAVLNNAFHELAGTLVAAGDMVAKTIKDEIDPEFSLTTIEIGHGFLDQGRYEEAARTISEDLKIIDGRIEGSIIDLSGRVVHMADDFREVLESRLIPAFESIGDSESAANYQGIVEQLQAISESLQGSRTLADMISIVEQSRRLADIATSTVTELRDRLNSIEAANDRRAPARYTWGKNNHAAAEVDQLLGSIKSMYPEPTISSRFSVIEKAVRAIDQQAKSIKHYSQVGEFLINYPNIEYVIEAKLAERPNLASSDLPVKSKYALEYLKMYAAKKYEEVTFEPRTATLKSRSGPRTRQDELQP